MPRQTDHLSCSIFNYFHKLYKSVFLIYDCDFMSDCDYMIAFVKPRQGENNVWVEEILI